MTGRNMATQHNTQPQYIEIKLAEQFSNTVHVPQDVIMEALKSDTNYITVEGVKFHLSDNEMLEVLRGSTLVMTWNHSTQLYA